MPEQHLFALLLALVAILGAMSPRRFDRADADLVWRRTSLVRKLAWRSSLIR